MGGSGGGGGIEVDSRLAAGQMQGLQGQLGVAQDLKGLATSQGLQALGGAGLTDAEKMQLAQVGGGAQQARRAAEQSVRSQSTARGMFSSAGAIGQEAAQLAGIEQNLGQQRAGVFGQAQQRQFQGIGLRGNLLGQAGGQFGSAAGGFGQAAQQSFQQQQVNQQIAQQQKQQQMGQIKQAGALIAAPFTGGASLGLLG